MNDKIMDNPNMHQINNIDRIETINSDDHEDDQCPSKQQILPQEFTDWVNFHQDAQTELIDGATLLETFDQMTMLNTEEDARGVTGDIAGPAHESGKDQNDDDAKKRRRRSSLLRRSMSVGDVQNEKKRFVQRQSTLRQSNNHLAQFLEGLDFEASDDDEVKNEGK